VVAARCSSAHLDDIAMDFSLGQGRMSHDGPSISFVVTRKTSRLSLPNMQVGGWYQTVKEAQTKSK
jgi:hypothetical protein